MMQATRLMRSRALATGLTRGAAPAVGNAAKANLGPSVGNALNISCANSAGFTGFPNAASSSFFSSPQHSAINGHALLAAQNSSRAFSAGTVDSSRAFSSSENPEPMKRTMSERDVKKAEEVKKGGGTIGGMPLFGKKGESVFRPWILIPTAMCIVFAGVGVRTYYFNAKNTDLGVEAQNVFKKQVYVNRGYVNKNRAEVNEGEELAHLVKHDSERYKKSRSGKFERLGSFSKTGMGVNPAGVWERR